MQTQDALQKQSAALAMSLVLSLKKGARSIDFILHVGQQRNNVVVLSFRSFDCKLSNLRKKYLWKKRQKVHLEWKAVIVAFMTLLDQQVRNGHFILRVPRLR
jgi:hypothetical protein